MTSQCRGVDKSLGLRRNWLRGNAHHEHRIPRRPGACQSLSGPSLFRHTDKPNRWLPPNPATASSHTQTLTLAPAKHSYHGSRNLHVRTIKKTAPCASYTRFSGAIYNEETVRRIQNNLISKGLYSGAVDGAYGDHTESAMRAFQEANGLQISGLPDQFSLLKLFRPSPTAGASASATPN